MGVSKKKQAEGMAFFAELLKQQGKADIEAEELTDKIGSARDARSIKQFQAEGVLLFLQTAGKSLQTKKCKQCGNPFATRYIAVAYCSDLCRAEKFRKDYGIRWDSSRDHYSMLDAERPLVVGPEAYQLLQEFARRILEEDILVLQDNPPEETLQEFPEVSRLEQLFQQELDRTNSVPSPPEQDADEQSQSQPFGLSDFGVQW